MARLRYGGQALVEGVLMRGRGSIAVALRAPDGRIVCETEPLSGTFRATRWAKLPFVRGLVVLYETLVVGTRWLIRSANLAASEEGVELGTGGVALMLTFTLAIGIGIFFFLPLLITRAALPNQQGILFHAAEGVVQVAIFLGYLLLISRLGDVKRTFQYHGAEHMSIHALENGDPLVVERVRRYPTAHPRCGTEFLVVVIIISIIAFSIVGKQPILVTVVSRIILVPIIAAVAYEVLQFGARHEDNRLVRAIITPGIWVQKITTKQPTDDMIEVAIVSLEEALKADGQAVPDGSADFPRSSYADALATQAVDGAVGAEATGAEPAEAASVGVGPVAVGADDPVAAADPRHPVAAADRDDTMAAGYVADPADSADSAAPDGLADAAAAEPGPA
jgi:uncharacterized protein YqhQ